MLITSSVVFPVFICRVFGVEPRGTSIVTAVMSPLSTVGELIILSLCIQCTLEGLVEERSW